MLSMVLSKVSITNVTMGVLLTFSHKPFMGRAKPATRTFLCFSVRRELRARV